MNKNEILDIVYQYADEKLNKTVFVPGVSPVPASGAVLYPEDIREVADTLLEFWYTDWKKCAEFKRRLCKVTGKKHCVLVNSGSSASLIAQTALYNRYPGKYIITTALGFPTTVYPIWQNDRVPIFIDTDPRTLSPNWEQYKNEFKDRRVRVSGSIFAHTLGFPFDEELVNSDFFFADCCDALGAKLKIVKGLHHVGLFADVMTLSFFPAHQITSAEGGAILTDNEELAREMEQLINWGRDCHCLPGQSNACGKRFEQNFFNMPEGWDHKYTFTKLGYNLKMTEFQAALGMSQLTHLDDFVVARRHYFYYLSEYLGQHYEYLDFVKVPSWSEPSPFGFPIYVKREAPFTAQELISYLEKHKISTRRFFGGNLTRQPFIRNLPYLSLDLTGTNYIMEQGFWLGVWPGLTKAHLDYVVEIFDKFFKEKGL